MALFIHNGGTGHVNKVFIKVNEIVYRWICRSKNLSVNKS